MREFKQFVRLVLHTRSLILLCPVLAMDCWVTQCWFRWRSTERRCGKQFLILFEQGGGCRGDLPGNLANHAPTSKVGSFSCTMVAFSGDQTPIEPGPFPIQTNNSLTNFLSYQPLRLQQFPIWGHPVFSLCLLKLRRTCCSAGCGSRKTGMYEHGS